MNDRFYQHVTVLLQEAVEALSLKEKGIYIDGTFGRGGHSRLILEKLDQESLLMVFDKDQDAIREAERLQQTDERLEVFKGSFTKIPEIINERKLEGKVNGILLDLGVSSPQLDDANRGFSFLKDGPLDMRMDSGRGMNAAEWIANAEEKEIAQVLKDFGEERYARRISRAIVGERKRQPILQTAHLAEIIKAAHPKWEKNKHPATRSFQAIRIYINRELDELQMLLDRVLDLLAIGGRLVVISFHSLEDRIVKRFIQNQSSGDVFPSDLPITNDQINRRMKKINKAVKPGEEEVRQNPRARSAVMRIAEKIA